MEEDKTRGLRGREDRVKDRMCRKRIPHPGYMPEWVKRALKSPNVQALPQPMKSESLRWGPGITIF